MKEITRAEILEKVLQNDKEAVKNFADAMNLTASLNREFTIADIDEEVGDAIEAIIRYWNKVDDEQNVSVEERKPIRLYIDSPGGSLHATFTIVDAIRMSKTPVYTINIGMAFSGGFLIFLSGHKRFAYYNSTFLFHEGSTGGGLPQDAGKFRNYATFYNTLLEKLKIITLQYTKISEEEYERHRLDDWWLCAEEAIELGICDKILTEFV